MTESAAGLMEAAVDEAARQPQRWVRPLVWCAVAGVIVYVALDIVVQALPPHYNPVTQAESDLSVGPYGWIMRINFVVRGLLSACLLAGLVLSVRPVARARLGMLLWGIWSAAALVLAVFNTDVGGGEHTLHGKIHLAVALVGFAAAPIGALLLSRSLVSQEPRTDRNQWPVVAAAASLGLLVLMVLLVKADIGGLTERLFLGSVLAWIIVMGVALLRRRPHKG